MRLLFAAALAAVAALGYGELRSEGAPETVRVVDVVDGDTIGVSIDGRRRPVRVIGIDTPEMRPRPECYGRAATRAMRRLVGGRSVRLVPDREARDRYRRRLAYVELPDGRDVGAELLRGGFARTLEIAPNTARAGRYERLERAARRADRGLWRACGGA